MASCNSEIKPVWEFYSVVVWCERLYVLNAGEEQ